MDIRKKSQKQEKRTAKEFGGRTQVASGALAGAKGDVRTGERHGSNFNENDFLIENKFTDKDYYQLRLITWQKIAKEAVRDNLRMPLMQIDIQTLQLVVMSKNDYDMLFDHELFDHIQTYNVTKGKSYRLNKDAFNSNYQNSAVVGKPYAEILMFPEATLAVMFKADFLSYMDEQ